MMRTQPEVREKLIDKFQSILESSVARSSTGMPTFSLRWG
jgi:hypothetical protein